MAVCGLASPSGWSSLLAATSGAARVWAVGAAAVGLALAGLGVLAAGWNGGGLLPASPSADDAAGVRVDNEVPVTAMHQGRGVANNSPELAAPAAESRLVAAAFRRDAPAFGCGLQLSGSAGGGWRPARPVTEATLPEGASSCYAPEVSFGPEGRIYYLFAGLHGLGNRPMGVFLATSDDGGQSFAAPQQVLGKHNFSVRMATGREQGQAYLAWLHAASEPGLAAMPPAPNPIKFAASADGGQSWSQPKKVNAEGHRRVAGPAMTVADDGTIYVAYYDLRRDQRDYKALAGPVYDGEWSVVLARSTDGGKTFTTTVVDDGVRPVERVMLIFTMAPPALAAGDDGQVCLGWPHAHQDHGDVRVRCSPDRGRTWGEASRANQDPGDSGAIHVLPQLDFAPSGRLDAAFLARNPSGELQHTYYAASRDGGRSFTDRRRITSQASSTRIGQRYTNNAAARGRVEFGSRLGLLARPTQSLVMWPDTRNSRTSTTGQDLFAARVTHPSTDEPRPAVVLAGGGLLAGGVLTVAVALIRRRRHARQPAPADAAAPAGQRAGATGDGGEFAGSEIDPPPPDAAGPPPVGTSRRRGWRRRGWTLAAAVAIGVIAVAAWAAQSPAPAPGRLPPDPPTITVTLDEDGITYSQPVPAGRVVIKVANRGKTSHGLTMVPLGDDEPPIGQLLTNDRVEVRAPFAGMPPLEPGETARFAVDLTAKRRYAVYDSTPNPNDPQGRLHAETDWHAEIRPTPASATAPDSPTPPTATPNR